HRRAPARPARAPHARRSEHGRGRGTASGGEAGARSIEKQWAGSIARPDSLRPASDRYVVVEASAGTGKTFFLEHRVVDLILGGAELAQILLVTFTDKAVPQLRMRIRDLLDRTARADVSAAAASYWELDEAARTRLRAA